MAELAEDDSELIKSHPLHPSLPHLTSALKKIKEKQLVVDTSTQTATPESQPTHGPDNSLILVQTTDTFMT